MLLFKLNKCFNASRWQPLNLKKKRVDDAYLSRRDDQVPTHERKHTHAKRREHLMCLLLVRVLINLVVLLDKQQ